MSEVWVADAGPLILLAKAGQLSLLDALADEILLPLPVVREIRKGVPNDPARKAIESGFGTRVPSVRIPAKIRSLGVLGAGEKAVLSLAWKRGDCTVLLDDKKGRNAADRLGIPKIGTLGVVLRAHKQGHISAIVPVLQDLLEAGLYLDQETLRGAAANVGEIWP